ncbi:MULTISPECIES: hypothetical protein [unclassified Sphingomonas]|uniref:hypothetical protein n=1 Tax=unclassified Sphingomonas TaxID=196159 RepID=UPI0006FF3FA3|nr:MULTISPECIES: hypothetical protein [unclassified Sphingomonas]KQX21683.1 hypothetical protein ASD17_06985 [Sphingomonas sp. Root1294]KQY72998.1 hypothetical protein ASD39_00970 [Sphingomonas sp. Root50]KRB88204.1 hypothetical protein ASE22_22465 [Sphingomonas sp. Root720]
MSFCRWIVLVCGLVAAPAAALPLDPLGDPDQFRRDVEEINRAPLPDGEPLARAIGDAVMVDARVRGRCQPKKISIGKLDPVTLDGMITGMIVAGQVENGWIVPVKLDDCPPADPIHVLLLRMADGKTLNGIFAGQGESLAWPTLSREALRATVGAASQRLRADDPQCAPRELTPTAVRVTGTSPDLGPSQYGIRLKGSWNELWTFEPCGHRLSIPIAFRTNGAGGAYWDIDQGGILFVK